MYKDKYYKKIEREYMSATGMVPTTLELSEFFYKRKQIGSSLHPFLIDLGWGVHGIYTEIGKGNVDTLLPIDTNLSLVEITPYTDTFLKDRITLVDGMLRLDRDNNVKIDSLFKKNYNVKSILSSVFIEGDEYFNNVGLYSKMYYDDMELFLGMIGSKNDNNYKSRIDHLERIKNLIEKSSHKKLEIYSNDTDETYQKVLYYKKK